MNNPDGSWPYPAGVEPSAAAWNEANRGNGNMMPYPGMPGFNPELQNLANGMSSDYSGAGMPAGWPGYPPLGPGMVRVRIDFFRSVVNSDSDPQLKPVLKLTFKYFRLQ